ncbi:MAG: hypothetical protein KatS3mg063_0169 [Tepidiforma sp.]|nr:MAG: hypothetical protein KatS3mg063_0169 [Tepidiforma sp.]
MDPFDPLAGQADGLEHPDLEVRTKRLKLNLVGEVFWIHIILVVLGFVRPAALRRSATVPTGPAERRSRSPRAPWRRCRGLRRSPVAGLDIRASSSAFRETRAAPELSASVTARPRSPPDHAASAQRTRRGHACWASNTRVRRHSSNSADQVATDSEPARPARRFPNPHPVPRNLPLPRANDRRCRRRMRECYRLMRRCPAATARPAHPLRRHIQPSAPAGRKRGKA